MLIVFFDLKREPSRFDVLPVLLQMSMQAMISVTQAQTADLGEESSSVASEMEAIGQETKKLVQQWRDDIAALHRKDEALQVSHSCEMLKKYVIESLPARHRDMVRANFCIKDVIDNELCLTTRSNSSART